MLGSMSPRTATQHAGMRAPGYVADGSSLTGQTFGVNPSCPARVIRRLAARTSVVVLSELIIPATDTPGAKEARVNEYIDLILQRWRRRRPSPLSRRARLA